MKPPWDHSGQSAAELEALQTDVMRFVAILGLCLAASHTRRGTSGTGIDRAAADGRAGERS